MPGRRAVFLDRDGVLNESVVRDGKPYPPASLAQVVIVPDALASLRRLKDHGFLLLVVTNQPDVRRGSTTQEQVNQIHHFLSSQLPLDDFFVCYHDDSDACRCRKPRPGLIEAGAAAYHVDVASSFLVGDRWRDIEAGVAAGCRTIFIDRGYNEKNSKLAADITVSSLSGAADWILEQKAHPTEFPG
ncbi:MAG: HAD family hydrolase [Acidobacteriaceae bacterium]|nr:HAD family hydrolase [Acidobacteriaceae bacterium]